MVAIGRVQSLDPRLQRDAVLDRGVTRLKAGQGKAREIDVEGRERVREIANAAGTTIIATQDTDNPVAMSLVAEIAIRIAGIVSHLIDIEMTVAVPEIEIRIMIVANRTVETSQGNAQVDTANLVKKIKRTIIGQDLEVVIGLFVTKKQSLLAIDNHHEEGIEAKRNLKHCQLLTNSGKIIYFTRSYRDDQII